ncbi:hypothetical protein SAMN05444156_2994 [Verrucomicrobium sp. GAS474]|nr:hypothetical protein SAMN05444156_2994 [Verrucomicrobium sp. GAS474]
MGIGSARADDDGSGGVALRKEDEEVRLIDLAFPMASRRGAVVQGDLLLGARRAEPPQHHPQNKSP